MDETKMKQPLPEEYVCLVSFLRNVSSDPTFETRFIEGYENAHHDKQGVVQSIWRFNNTNRRITEAAIARVDKDPDRPLGGILRAIRTHGIKSVETVPEKTVCDICHQHVLFARRVTLRSENGGSWVVRSDFAKYLRFFDVVCHFVDCTLERFAKEGMSMDIRSHYNDLVFCRMWVESLCVS